MNRSFAIAALVVSSAVGIPARAADLTIYTLTANPSDPNGTWPPKPGDEVRIVCTLAKAPSGGEEAQKLFGNARGRFLVDGKPLPLPSSADFYVTQPSAVATWRAIAGTHQIRCELDYKNVVAETNETNNRREIAIKVSGKPLPRVAQTTQVEVAGVVVPGGKSKACKAMIYSTVQMDKTQFSAQEGVPEANPAKMTLDLVTSAGLGNYVHCEYQSVGKDVKLVYTFQCANAHQAGAKHIYACD
jgi:hypothetical protein